MEAATGAEWSDGQLQHQPKRRERRREFFVLKKYEIKEFFFLFFSSRVIHLAGLSHRASSPFIISTLMRPVWEVDESPIYIYTYSGVLFCSSIYTQTSERVGSLSSHTHTHTAASTNFPLHCIPGWLMPFFPLRCILYTHCVKHLFRNGHISPDFLVGRLIVIVGTFFLSFSFVSFNSGLFFWLDDYITAKIVPLFL